MNRFLLAAMLLIIAFVALNIEGCGGTPKKLSIPVGPKAPPKSFKANIPEDQASDLPDDGVFDSIPSKDEPYKLGPNDRLLIRIKDRNMILPSSLILKSFDASKDCELGSLADKKKMPQ